MLTGSGLLENPRLQHRRPRLQPGRDGARRAESQQRSPGLGRTRVPCLGPPALRLPLGGGPQDPLRSQLRGEVLSPHQGLHRGEVRRRNGINDYRILGFEETVLSRISLEVGKGRIVRILVGYSLQNFNKLSASETREVVSSYPTIL